MRAVKPDQSLKTSKSAEEQACVIRSSDARVALWFGRYSLLATNLLKALLDVLQVVRHICRCHVTNPFGGVELLRLLQEATLEQLFVYLRTHK